ncbi:hypothetical protein H4J58_08545 [Colwellia sp. MB3u-70]|uniref:hypothetical protein n=1 Tax=unclassified Colwellia TaxID=196834 RepID=UPI0015F4F6CD|nr:MULTISPECIES: hypothetical protein [unclassified Colwellia]MBA6292387.1 hypothetical protein [Colwellia sp. MB3u-8]MBA6307162.1 hypothetical protein [Colwellia sp. MB3u-70]
MFLTDFLTASYRLTLNSPLHWALVILASIGLVISCLLIYRRFKDDVFHDEQKIAPLGARKKLHFFLLLFGNIIAFISVLLFVLPLEEKAQTSSFDVLLTPGFKHTANGDDFNLVGIDKTKILQALTSAERIWLLAEQGNSSADEPLYQWLAKHYQHKVFVTSSVQEVTDFWSKRVGKQPMNFRTNNNVPSLVQVFGDGLTKLQWQHFQTFNAQQGIQQRRQEGTQPEGIQQEKNKQRLASVNFRFFASKAIIGLSHLTWPRQLILGQALTVTGQLQQPIDNNAQFQLSLVNNNNVLSSIIIAGNEPFSLTTTSKFSGLFNYQLVLREREKTLLQQGLSSKKALVDISEDIAFSVVMGNQPRVLIKQSAPSFETRRLKQWLSQANSEVHIISQISKNKWAQQHINVKNTSEDNEDNSNAVINNVDKSKQQNVAEQAHILQKKLLDNYDVLIIDSRMLLALEESEIQALYRSVNKGLGLLIKADATLLKIEKSKINKLHRLLNLFSIKPVDVSLSPVIANWPGKPRVEINQTITPQTAAIAINAKVGGNINSIIVEPLVESTTGQTLVAKQSLGLGSLAISSLNQTYQWSLQASPEVYSHYWQYILSKISRSESTTRWLSPMPTILAQVNQYQDICLISPLETISSPQMQLMALVLSKHKKCGQFSADQAGWYMFQALDDNQALLAKQAQYFYPAENFLAWQQADKHQASEGFMKIMALSRDDFIAADTYQPINKIYLWLCMFISLGLLWIERKWQTN